MLFNILNTFQVIKTNLVVNLFYQVNFTQLDILIDNFSAYKFMHISCFLNSRSPGDQHN